MVSLPEKALVIVESPTKARTIAKFLPKGYHVEASIGHIRDLPTSASEIPKDIKGEKWSRLGINVDHEFEPIYVVPTEKKKQVKKLRDLLKEVDVVYLATDEDREGEAISWHLIEVLAPNIPQKRLVFHEITKKAIHEALANPRELDTRMVKAQETRRILDRLYGYEISPILWRKVAPRLSAGRVQSVTVRLIVERERERQRFVKSTYWDLTAGFQAGRGPEFSTVLSSLDGKRIARGKDFDSETGLLKSGDGKSADVCLIDEPMATQLVEDLGKSDWKVSSVERKPYTDRPAPPFTTSTLQQEANRKLRLSARVTMQAAQRLYENGLITYMRTDSTSLAQSAIDSSRSAIERLYGKEFVPDEPRIYKTKVKNAQEAHEAIRPSEEFKRPEDLRATLNDREYKVYEMIWKRTMACQMEDARGHRMTLKISDGRAVFQATGKTIEFPGYLRAYVEGADDPDAELADKELLLPAVSEGEVVDLKSLISKDHTTQPPARYTEASLVKMLEGCGVGRPSTYATIIDTILSRSYVVKQGTALVPTFVAFAVVKLMEQHFGGLVDTTFTARMEDDLDAIALGTMEALPYLKRFYFGEKGEGGTAGLKNLIQTEIDARDVCTLPLGKDAEGNMINVRVGRYGPYLERGEERATVPDGLAPDELTIAAAEEILRKGSGPQELGEDPETDCKVYAKTGRYGAYFQLGENDDEPKMKSLLPGMDVEEVTLEDAMKMLKLPRVVGQDPDGEDVLCDYGRYGSYVKRGSDTRSLEKPEDIWDLTMEKALEKLAEPPARGGKRRASKVLKELGVDPKTELPIRLLSGPYGPYVSDGTIHASIEKDADPEKVTLEIACDLITVREATGKVRRKKKKSAKKKASKKKATKKKAASKKVAKKATTKAKKTKKDAS
ncbi:MAG: DNA topoisomerase-1 [Planctomycetota bacterium]|jgi:DNA topoisomerase-1